jgi:hypothetical protein
VTLLTTCFTQACGQVSAICVHHSVFDITHAGLSVISLVEAAEMFALLIITSLLCTRDRKCRCTLVHELMFVSICDGAM